MKKYIVRGGVPLRGSITISGSKNAAFPILAASVPTKDIIHLKNLPDIADINQMLRAMSSIGVIFRRTGSHSIVIDSRGISEDSISRDRKRHRLRRSRKAFRGCYTP